ncbi:hypothetical protein C3492_39670 [Streptomyces sp. Ru62]|uniref:BlaI/MecI/CopY family transcriptional regulator n=1 Tax=Streptomyces sp. Ru62 TaxID=2080745 RepID=UPI000CDD7786|nr:BlaI/MecI/CopY family transcriptional regulator [Streptomyces sp. Ru62]POX58093.1 hypothetical protein C3492_39670 [Streptomyces sp. Ru62]
MADEPEKTPIQNKYAQQYAEDLAANRREQGEITAQIAALHERLERLKEDEAWLTQAQGRLPGAGTAASEAEPAAEAEGAAVADQAPSAVAQKRASQDEPSVPAGTVAKAPRPVPAQRAETQDKPATGKKAAAKDRAAAKKSTAKTTAKKTSTTKKATPKKTTAAKAPAKEAPAKEASAEQTTVGQGPGKKTGGKKADGPALHELVLLLLLKSAGHPHTVREVFDAVKAAHPERATSVQTVRNTLELLVKKGRIERSRQQKAVMYTAHPGQDSAAASADSTGETVGAEQVENDKVPAQV